MTNPWHELRDSRLRLREDGIFELRHFPDVTQSLDDAKAQVAAMRAAAGEGNPRPAMIVVGRMKGQDRDAREYLMKSDEVWTALSAVAVVVATPVGRVIGSLFLGLIRPRVQLRLFDDERQALAWLAEVDA